MYQSSNNYNMYYRANSSCRRRGLKGYRALNYGSQFSAHFYQLELVRYYNIISYQYVVYNLYTRCMLYETKP